MNLEALDDKPLFSMTGREFRLLIKNMDIDELSNKVEPEKGKKYVYGIKGIAEIIGKSIATANRLKKSGIIDKAIIQNGRTIIVDTEHALQLMKENSINERN